MKTPAFLPSDLEARANGLAADLAAAVARAEKAEAVLRQVEEWWLREGMHILDGAPACMFNVRALLSALRDPQPVGPRRG